MSNRSVVIAGVLSSIASIVLIVHVGQNQARAEVGDCASKTLVTYQDQDCVGPPWYGFYPEPPTCEQLASPFDCVKTAGAPAAKYWKYDKQLLMGNCQKSYYSPKGCKTCVADALGYRWEAASGLYFVKRDWDPATNTYICKEACDERWTVWTKNDDCSNGEVKEYK